MNLPNLPMSRWERWCLVLLRKPVLWAFMVCTGGATLVVLQGMAESQRAGWPNPSAKQTIGGSVVVSGAAASAAPIEKRPVETER